MRKPEKTSSQSADFPAPKTLAIVDLGSNSFRLEIGEVHGRHIRVQETLRDMLRLASGLDRKNRLTKRARVAALECLSRFGERLRDFSPAQVRAVATNTFRVATNINEFLPTAEKALGFPIEVISGHEEARLIFVGTTYTLPRSTASRLIVDIGGGSTEFAIGTGHTPKRLESLKLGCVSMTCRFFDGGELSAERFKNAETYARAEIVAIADRFNNSLWQEAFASSGSAQALCEILENNGFSESGITAAGLRALKRKMIQVGNIDRLQLESLKPERAPVLAGGLVIMLAVLEELQIPLIRPVGGALRLGAMYDLMGRHLDQDSRVVTVEHWMTQHRVDREHVQRVAHLALDLFARLCPDADPASKQVLRWAALLHCVGATISNIGFHKHSAYMLKNGDMPGFSSLEQEQLATLALNCRGSLDKAGKRIADATFRAQILALRIALILYRAQRPMHLPQITIALHKKSCGFHINERWLAAHPLTAFLLNKEASEWKDAGYGWRCPAHIIEQEAARKAAKENLKNSKTPKSGKQAQ